MIFASCSFVKFYGPFLVTGPKGPFDCYETLLKVPSNFPFGEPVVHETGGRIPMVADRHVFEDCGKCCLGIWEEWLLLSPDNSFERFLTGYLHDYFVSQTYFEKKEIWPFGERSHGIQGITESFAELLGVRKNTKIVVDYLRLLAYSSAKGRHLCPCGSGRRLRNCHWERIEELRKRIQPGMAKRMLARMV